MRLLLVLFVAATSLVQTPLQGKIRAIAVEAKGQPRVAFSLPGTPLNCDLKPHAHPPLQSVFKLPVRDRHDPLHRAGLSSRSISQ